MRSLETQQQEQENTQGVHRQIEPGAAPVADVVTSMPPSPTPKPLTSSVQLTEVGIQRQCSECAEEQQEQSAEDGKDFDEMSLGTGAIQTKLTVGAPGDQYEQEADRVAAQVMSMSVAPDSSPQVQRFGEEDNPVQRWSLAQSITPVVQRQVDEQVQMRELVQRAFQAGGKQASGDLESRLNASKGGGSALAPEVRAFMEPRFGADFSGVRVHTGTEAVQMNRELGAQAFAHGSDVYFGAGKSPGNNELTAHELTHVIQQTGSCQDQRPVPHSTLSQLNPQEEVLKSHHDTHLQHQDTDSLPKEEEIQTQSSTEATMLIQRQERPPRGEPEDVEGYEQVSQILSSLQAVIRLHSQIQQVINGFQRDEHGQREIQRDPLAVVANLTELLQSLATLVEAISSWTDEITLADRVTIGPVRGVSSALQHVTQVLRAIRLVGRLANRRSLQDYLDNPRDYDRAVAWATEVGDIFSDAAEILPDSPPQMAYFKSLFAAPEVIIRAFTSILTRHRDRIDAASGGTYDGALVREGGEIRWEGPLSHLYASFSPPGLRELMQEIRDVHDYEIDGVDISNVPRVEGEALLIRVIRRRVNYTDARRITPEQRTQWIQFITTGL
jgi:hypothetical protein